MTATSTDRATALEQAPWTTRNKVGLVLLAVYAVGNVPSGFSSGSSDSAGAPRGILVLDAVLGVAAVVAVVLGWRLRSRAAVRLASAACAVITLTALPAFFVSGVPAAVRLLVAGMVVLTVAAVVLALTPDRRV